MSTAVSAALRAAVRREEFPKAAVDVWVTVLEADGGETAAAATAGALALADAGVPLRDLVASCSLVSSASPSPHTHARTPTHPSISVNFRLSVT